MSRNSFNPQVHNWKGFLKGLLYGSLGVAESYGNGDFDCEHPDALIAKVMKAADSGNPSFLARFLLKAVKTLSIAGGPAAHLTDEEKAAWPYNTGNELFEQMLGPTMAYTCAYLGRGATNLLTAQNDKFHLILEKGEADPGKSLIDIGGGYGGLSRCAARDFGMTALSITVAKNQIDWSNAHRDGLPVESRVENFLNLTGQADLVASVGMLEHAPGKYPEFMAVVNRCLKPDGIFVLHCMETPVEDRPMNPVVDKWLFPGSRLGSERQILEAASPYFVQLDEQDLSPDYDWTIMRWMENIRPHLPELEARYGKKYIRIFWFGMHGIAASFRTGGIELKQRVFAKTPRPGYRIVR